VIEARICGAPRTIGRRTDAAPVFFLSPTCPVCKHLAGAALDRRAEAAWLDVVLASDGPAPSTWRTSRASASTSFDAVTPSGLPSVGKLPGALLDEEACARIGLVNSREHLESLRGEGAGVSP
jgi:hypothetical protein